MKYLSFQLLGKGSFGVVFRGIWRTATDSIDVAIKYFETENEKSEFLVERRQLARVHHENIIGLYGASVEPQVFLIMEYAECGSLYKVMPLEWILNTTVHLGPDVHRVVRRFFTR